MKNILKSELETYKSRESRIMEDLIKYRNECENLSEKKKAYLSEKDELEREHSSKNMNKFIIYHFFLGVVCQLLRFELYSNWNMFIFWQFYLN